MEEPLATLEDDGCKAEIYESALPGSFTVRYRNEKGEVIAEESLTGVSTYRQREKEIRERLHEIRHGGQPESATLADSGEYSG